VPCWHPDGGKSRSNVHPVNLTYAAIRWGAARAFRVSWAFASALFTHKWFNELAWIVRNKHRYGNLKELARALYRSKLFESFLRTRIGKEGNQVDLIYFYWMVPELMGAIAFRDTVQPGLKIVSRAHGGDLYRELRPGAYIGLRDTIVRGIDEIYCISEHGKTYLEDRYPFLKSILHTARLGVDDPVDRNVQPSDEPLSIITCSFVLREKRLHLIVDAIEHLLRVSPWRKIKWTHVGDGELYDELRAAVSARLGTRAQVIFKGYLSYPQVMELYRNEKFDVFINVSDSEGIPVSLMEASAFGIPMIATNVGGNNEIVNAENGVLMSANPDIETLAATLVRFSDRPAAIAFRQRARALWEEKYNAAINHDRFGKALIKVLE
jgi:glycosyltransferase involved in cell wall biosynthesis